MLGEFASFVLLFLIAGVIGFAAGWVLRRVVIGPHVNALREDVEGLRRAVNEAHVRRARSI
jgi:hypothetical protein